MLEDFDPYLTSFFRDVGTCISIVFQTVELILGFSYFIGRKTVEGAIWMTTASTNGYQEISTAAATVRDEVAEFGISFGRALLLIYFAAIKVVDSFFIVAVDLKNLYFHVTDSICRTVAQSSYAVARCVTALFTVVPNQLVEALCMVGEASLGFCECLTAIIVDFFKQLVLAPVNVVVLVGKLLVKLTLLPVKFVSQMPPSSFLGLIVIILVLFLTRRLLRYVVLRNVLWVLNGVVNILCRVLSLIRLPRFNYLLRSSVSTFVRTNEQITTNHSKPHCVICHENPIAYMTDPCKHVCLCDQCVYQYIEHDNRCPMCRSRVTKYDRVFIP